MTIDNIHEYCEKEFIPKPYRYCENILQQIIRESYKFSFLEIWEWINRNLVNIYGILSDIRLISESELLTLKQYLIEESYSIEKLDINKNLPTLYISTTYKLYFNKIDYMRIPKINAEITSEGFFQNKNIDLPKLSYFDSKPFLSKYYLALLQNIGSWDIMIEQNKLTLEQLTDLLYKLNDQMSKHDLNHETLYIIGGYVCLTNKDKYFTSDIDFFCKNEAYSMRRLAYDIGEQYNCIGWLSDLYSLAKNGYTISLDDYLSVKDSFHEYISLSKLTIYIQTDKCLLCTKLNSGREKDIDDAKNIINRLNLSSKEQIIDFISEYIELPSVKKDSIYDFIDICLKKA